MPRKKVKTKPSKESQPRAPKRDISETLIDFTKPILELLDREVPYNTFEKVFQIAVTVWNAVVLDHLNITSQYTDKLESTVQNTDMPLMETLVHELIERKRNQFAQDLRIIGECQASLNAAGELEVKAEARVVRLDVN